jgi:hypothetical protein
MRTDEKRQRNGKKKNWKSEREMEKKIRRLNKAKRSCETTKSNKCMRETSKAYPWSECWRRLSPGSARCCHAPDRPSVQSLRAQSACPPLFSCASNSSLSTQSANKPAKETERK